MRAWGSNSGIRVEGVVFGVEGVGFRVWQLRLVVRGEGSGVGASGFG